MARTSQDIDAARALYTRISSIYDTLSDKGERRIRGAKHGALRSLNIRSVALLLT